MRTVDVSELVFDDESEDKFAEHAVTVTEVAQVHFNGPVYRRNRRDRRATHLMIGQTSGGRWLIVPIAPWGSDQGVWRPVTAFEPTASQITHLAQMRRHT